MEPAEEVSVAGAAAAPPRLDESAMADRFGLIGRMLVRAAFHRIRVDQGAVERVRQLAAKGSLVYVLHQRSIIDYLMVNAVLLREGLPLPQFATGVSALWFRRIRDIVQLLRQRVGTGGLFGRAMREAREKDRCVELVHARVPVLLFMRVQRRRRWGKRAADPAVDAGADYLSSIVHSMWGRSGPVYFVPIAIFRGAGYPKREARRSALFYIVREAPSEAKRLLAYVWNRRHLAMSIGSELSVSKFIEQHRHAGQEQIVHRITRALHSFIFSEERVVWGPPLRARSVIRDAVLSGGEMASLVGQLARERRVREEDVWKEAENYFEEMAANFDGLYFGFLAFLLKRLWPRVFGGLEILGLDRTVQCLRQHPIVLVPCHRSHIDYLVLSWIFHEHFLSPLHIAAGKNLSFWPLGPLFRGAGAYFIRRSFEGNPLYKLVFRNYLTFLIREGYTQEFFIEGGRTRTGKILTPKLGMLSAIVNAFCQGGRDDLYLVPVSIHYGRIVESEAYRREVAGEEKERESLLALLRASSVLRQRYGTVCVRFGDPISLSDALGESKQRFLTGRDEPAIEEEKRYFVQKLGFRLLREVNGAAVAGATSVTATVLLSADTSAVRRDEFLRATSALVDLLRFLGVHFTASLERNVRHGFRESMEWLGSQGLLHRLSDAGVDVLHIPPEKRINVDFYKNNLIHFFLLPSLMSSALSAGVKVESLAEEVWWWLDLYRWEFARPEREGFGREMERLVGYFRSVGALNGDLPNTEHPLIRATVGILDNFREAYRVTAKTLAVQSEWPVGQPQLLSRIRRTFSTQQLLGDVRKPEANSTITYINAINRFSELDYIRIRSEGRSSKDRSISAGDAHGRLGDLVARLEAV